MELEEKRWPRWFSRAAYLIFALLLILSLLSFFLSSDAHLLPTIGLLGLELSLGLFLLCQMAEWGTKKRLFPCLLCLLLLCFGVKLFWVLYAQVEPMGDYETFFGYAKALSGGTVILGGRYMALFPHLFFYSLFLSLFGSVFGFSQLLAPMLNVILSTISCALLFFLGNRLLGRKAAILAALLWTFFPSQTIYNMYVLSEPLYTTEILLFLSLLVLFFTPMVKRRPQRRRAATFGLLAGLVLALVNMTRPVGVILLLGLGLWLLFLQPYPFQVSAVRWNLLFFLPVLLLTYLLVGHVSSTYLEYRIGEPVSSVPGYNIYVGFNEKTDGRWNQEDSDLLRSVNRQDTVTAPQVQEKMLELAKERIKSVQQLPCLLWNKLTIFLGHDDACVGYGITVLCHKDFLSAACNSLYLFCCLLALPAALSAFWRADRSSLFLVMVYFPGLTFAQMLMEVSGRYHYSLLPVLVLFAAGGISDLGAASAPYQGKRLRPH